ncbi:MAG: hypothetical protein ACEY3M_01915 [Wolbachia sp.]
MTRASCAFFLFGKFLNIYGNMNWAGRCHSSAPFFVIPVGFVASLAMMD